MSLLRIKLLDVQDYLNMRSKNLPTSIKWEQVKRLTLKGYDTFWSLCQKLDPDYIPDYEPSKVTLEMVAQELNLKFDDW